MAGVVIVFDFDRTLISDDSDRWVVVNMGLTHLFNQLRSTLPWTSLMNRMMEELHSRGVTTSDIAECLKRVPLHPRIIESIKYAHSKGCELRIISDANQFFIETILKSYELFDCFSDIDTNPTFIDAEDRLRILPYHDTASPHGCNLCPPNMCKGMIIDRIRNSNSENGNKRFIYLGDGSGDLCPILKLGTGDHVMPRKNYPLWEHIKKNPNVITADIHGWSLGVDLAEILNHLIDKISVEDDVIDLNSSKLNSVFPVPAARETFPPELPVPN